MSNATHLFKIIFGMVFVSLFSSVSIPYNSYSQDMFGMITNIPTSYVTKSEVTTQGHVYITVWGSGVYRTQNPDAGMGNVVWDNISTGITNYYLSDIEFIGTSELYVATIGGGIFKTTSLTNVNWIPVNTGLRNLNVKSLKAMANGWLLAGTYGGGIYLSKNKGSNWTEVNQGLLYRDITSIEIAKNGWILAATYGGGVFQSRDTAKTWKPSSSGIKNLYVNEVKRNSLGHLFAATNGKGVYVSVNDGVAWAALDTTMLEPQKIIPVPLPDLNTTSITFNKNDKPVFGTRYGGIYAEDNEVDFTWIPTRVRGEGVNTLTKNSTRMFAFTPYSLPKTSDNIGEEWTSFDGLQILNLSPGYKIFTSKEKEIISYVKNLLRKTTDDGVTWESILGPTYFNQMGIDSSGKYYAATAAGIFTATDKLNDWIQIPFLDKDTNVYSIAIAPNGTIFAAISKNVFFKEKNGNWTQSSGLPFSDKSPHPDLIAINYNGHVYVAAENNLYLSTNNGLNWQILQKFDHRIYCINFLTDNTVLIGTGGSGLFKSTSPTQFARISNYPAASVETMFISKNDVIYTSGGHALRDSAFAVYEATYMSNDLGNKFINLNNSFNGEKVFGFYANNTNDVYMVTVSGVIYRAVHSKNMDVPALITIADKSVDIETGTKFEWHTSNRAELYQLEISYNEDFSYIWESLTSSDTSHINVNTLDQNHTYYWRVRAKNHSAYSEWTQPRSFISKLAKPVLLSPIDKSDNIPVYASLLWHQVEGASKYQIQISTKIDFSTIEHDLISIDTNIVTPLLSGRTKYYWRIKAKNDISSSNWSDVWSFNTVFGPPELTFPSDSATGMPLLFAYTWSKAADVEEYDIIVATDVDFISIVMQKTNISQLNVQSEYLEYDKRYYWKVRSRNGNVTSEWSIIFTFRTGYSPVVLLTPVNDAVNVKIRPELEWEQHISQNNYEIEISKNSNFQPIDESSQISDKMEYSAQNLESYQDYFWRVRVKSIENTGLWSEHFKFKTMPAKIILRFPTDESENNPLTIGFLWYLTKGASTYHLQIANDALFNDLIFSQDTITNVSYSFSNLNPGSKYYWRVRAVSPEGVGEWSDVWEYSTGSNIPVLISPENGNDKVVSPVVFLWQPVQGALSYELAVSEQANFAQTALKQENINENQFSTSELSYPKQYYWRVRAKMEDSNTPWSQVWSFGTKDPSSVENNSQDLFIAIYPNPSSDYIFISAENFAGKFKIINSIGVRVDEFELSEKNNIMIDITQYPAGVYILRADNVYYKFIKID